MEVLATYSNYRDFKQALDQEMYGAVESFVKIGYLLQFAEETNIVNEGGYATVNEFAKAEYGIDATQVSRFINIHKRFGVPGEPRLQEQYKNHGVAKLGIMLTLPDYINEEIPADYSKAEIHALKNEIEAEHKISDLEVMMEEKDPVQQSLPEGFKQAVYQMLHDYPEEYLEMYHALTLDELKDALAPNGECSYTFRVPGTGKMILFAKATGNIGIINVRSGDKEHFEWKQLWECAKEYFVMGKTAKESWSNVFNEAFPEEEQPKEEVQQESKPEPKKETRKESKVKTPVQKPKEKQKADEQKEPEPQLPGQDNIMNHPEYLPDDMKDNEPELVTGDVEDIEADEINVQQDYGEVAPVQENKTITGYKAAIRAGLNQMEQLVQKNDWDKLIVEAEKTAWRAKQIKEMEEKG